MFVFIINMNTISNNNINFSGIKLRNIKVKQILPTEGDFVSSLVEFKPDSKQDLKTLQRVNEIWQNNSFISNIVNLQSDLTLGRCRKDGYRILAITTQKEKFGKLDPNKILSIVQIKSNIDNSAKIEFLEAKKNNKEYKHAGLNIVEGLKEMYKKLTLFAENSSLINFYEKCNFISTSKSDPLHMQWQRL